MRDTTGAPATASADAPAGALPSQHASRRPDTQQAAGNLDSARSRGSCGPHLPRCAGVADPEIPVWICFLCAANLCRRKPTMPGFALSTWNWGGRLHPLYTDLSIAMQALLGLAMLVCRMIVLRYADKPEEQERGSTGNTILLARPAP